MDLLNVLGHHLFDNQRKKFHLIETLTSEAQHQQNKEESLAG